MLLECGFTPSPPQPSKHRTRLPVLESKKPRFLERKLLLPGPTAGKWQSQGSHPRQCDSRDPEPGRNVIRLVSGATVGSTC